MNISIQALKAFQAAAETGNFTRAAERCYLSQPAFSRLIAGLEKELGVKLFRRNTRRVELTEEGSPEGQNVVVGNRMYTCHCLLTQRDAEAVYVLYFFDDHDLKVYAKEYFDSRPWVLLMVIDNFSELFVDAKENERSKTMGEIEHIIETFAEENCGLLKKLDKDRYIAVIEDRYMRQIEASRFQVLDQIRGITAGDRISATMSIGVGSKEGSLHESEALARQALDMALGRGGDQAAVKLRDGYEFFGGVSKGVEKRNKVRTRIVANAITEIIQTSQNILVMGQIGRASCRERV